MPIMIARCSADARPTVGPPPKLPVPRNDGPTHRGEDDFLGVGADEVRDLLAGLLHRLLRCPAVRVCARVRVAVLLREEGQHVVQHTRVHGRRRLRQPAATAGPRRTTKTQRTSSYVRGRARHCVRSRGCDRACVTMDSHDTSTPSHRTWKSRYVGRPSLNCPLMAKPPELPLPAGATVLSLARAAHAANNSDSDDDATPGEGATRTTPPAIAAPQRRKTRQIAAM
jgi:hypothetical protein